VKKKKKTSKRSFKLNLVNNGIDFVRSGIETFFKEDTASPTDHKYAVIHMFAGTLLILKARLAKAHRSLIYVNVGEAKKQSAKTVDFKELMARLEACTKTPLSEKDQALLKKAQEKRNSIEHYVCDLDLEDTQVLVGDLAEFLLRFLHDELNTNLKDRLTKPVWERLSSLKNIAAEIHRARRKKWEAMTQRLGRLSEADFDREIEKLAVKGKPRWFYCKKCGLRTRRNPDPDRTVLQTDPYFGICTNSQCRELYGPETCGMCDEPLSQERRKDGQCLMCWAELHLSPEEMYDDWEDEEGEEEPDEVEQ
jgi:hypothetical protein